VTTGHKMVIQFFTSSNMCYCTIWGKQNQRSITFLRNAVLLLYSNNAQKHFVHIFDTLADIS